MLNVGDLGPKSTKQEDAESHRAPTTDRPERRRDPEGGELGGSIVQCNERREKSMLLARANSCTMAVSKVVGWVIAERGTLAGSPIDAHDPRKLARAAKSTTNWSSVNVVG